MDLTEPLYEPLRQDERLGAAWNDAMATLGYDTALGPGLSGGSTDMGEVAARSLAASLTTPIHTESFAAAAVTEGVERMMLDSALGLAWAAARG